MAATCWANFGSNPRYGAWSDYGTFMYGSGSKILVNLEGKHFHNELYGGGFSCNALYPTICEQPEGRTFGIIDSANPDVRFVQNSTCWGSWTWPPTSWAWIRASS